MSYGILDIYISSSVIDDAFLVCQYGMVDMLDTIVLDSVCHVEADRTLVGLLLQCHINIDTILLMMDIECFDILVLDIEENKEIILGNDAAGHGRGIITHRHHHPKSIESVIS